MNPKISVIVPVYKAEKYLHQCVDSILSQTFHDFEVLLIDDGSPDLSGLICDEYSAKDSRVKVFHKINGGVSSARQCGIDNAIGEYTIHVDPDDWIEPNMLDELYKRAIELDADMVICDYYEEYNNQQLYCNQQPSNLNNETVLQELFTHLHGSCWNKLIRRFCYKNFNVKFPLDLSCNEDLYVCISLLINPIKIDYINKAYYHYTQYVNLNSLVRKPKSYDERLFVMDKFCTLMYGNKYYDICYQYMATDLVYSVFCNMQYTSFEFKSKFYKFRNVVLTNKNISLHLRLRLYFSCVGLYKPILIIQNTLIRIFQHRKYDKL